MSPTKKTQSAEPKRISYKFFYGIISAFLVIGCVIYAKKYCAEKKTQDEFKQQSSYYQDQYLVALKIRNIERNKMPKISLPSPDIHKKERDSLQIKLSKAQNISDCKSIALEMSQLGPACSESFGTWLCHNLGQEYRGLVISCISNMAINENKSDLCMDENLQKDICVEWGKLMADQENLDLKEPSDTCVNYVREECLLSFAKKLKKAGTMDITL